MNPIVKDRRAASQAQRSMSLDSGFYSGASGSNTHLETWPEYYGGYAMPAPQQLPLPSLMPQSSLPLLNNYANPLFDPAQPIAPIIQDDDGMSQFWQAGALTNPYQVDDLSLRYAGMHPYLQ